nr:zinc finger BED domain-containing protein 4-like [Vanessa tameamea]
MTVDSAKCKQCGKSFSRKECGTTSLKLHLKSQHSDKYKELMLLEKGNQQNKPQTTKQLTPLQECKKQLTQTDSLKNKGSWGESNSKQKEIDKLVAEMIALQNLHFNFVEGVGFQRLVQAALPRYNLRGRQYFTNLLYWGLSTESVQCILRDKGSNMIKAMSTANFTDANCTIHQLQLCVRSAMETEEFLSPTLFYYTHVLFFHRWNSTYYMMERIFKLKGSLIMYSGAHTIPIPTADEWLDLKKCIAILKPFEEITKELSSATTTIASVIPLIYTLKNTLETEKNKEDTSENFKLIVTKMIHNISVRFQDIEHNKIYTIATYLDPRYKLKFFTEITKEQVQKEILGILGCSTTSHDEGPSSPKTPRSQLPSTSSSTYSYIQSCLAEILSANDEEEQNIGGDDDDTKRLTLSEKPLLWWNMHTEYSSLSTLVRQYLAPPPGSVPSEQLFSAAGLIYDPLRNRISGDKAAKLLFVKYN